MRTTQYRTQMIGTIQVSRLYTIHTEVHLQQTNDILIKYIYSFIKRSSALLGMTSLLFFNRDLCLRAKPVPRLMRAVVLSKLLKLVALSPSKGLSSRHVRSRKLSIYTTFNNINKILGTITIETKRILELTFMVQS